MCDNVDSCVIYYTSLQLSCNNNSTSERLKRFCERISSYPLLSLKHCAVDLRMLNLQHKLIAIFFENSRYDAWCQETSNLDGACIVFTLMVPF